MSDEVIVAAMDPRGEVARAHEMAKVLRDVVRQARLSKAFSRGGKEHLFFEAWQTIGRFFGCAAEIEWSRPIWHADHVIGWEARARVVDQTGRAVAAAESMCAKDEPAWRDRPAYAIRSMAQTRASAKALRQAFAWVAVLAGYSPTPAEEMDGILLEDSPAAAEAQGPPASLPSPQERASAPSAGEAPWTAEQRKAIWAKCLKAGLDREGAKDFVDWALAASGKSAWTRRYASRVLDDFNGMIGAYLEQAGGGDGPA